MGKIKEQKKIRDRKKNVVDLNQIAGVLTEKEKNALLSGSDFVEVPAEELKRLRIDVYPYLM